MHDLRNLTWKLNWYRQSELEGALLLGRMVRQASDPDLVHQLTKHAADEARHAWLWQRTLSVLRLPTVRIARSYQSFYLDAMAPPRGIAEVLALTHVFEHRVHRQFTQDLTEPGLPDLVCHTFNVLLKDEDAHLDWVARWLAGHPDGAVILDRYRAIDEQVYEQLLPFRDRIWDIPDLGTELAASEVDDDEKELHPV